MIRLIHFRFFKGFFVEILDGNQRILDFLQQFGVRDAQAWKRPSRRSHPSIQDNPDIVDTNTNVVTLNRVLVLLAHG